jgi:hypothetical protein
MGVSRRRRPICAAARRRFRKPGPAAIPTSVRPITPTARTGRPK